MAAGYAKNVRPGPLKESSNKYNNRYILMPMIMDYFAETREFRCVRCVPIHVNMHPDINNLGAESYQLKMYILMTGQTFFVNDTVSV